MKIFIVDAFSKKSFKGNPAGVFMLNKKLSNDFLQKVASEINLSETAFVESRDDKTFNVEKNFHLRWFTPEVEMKLCGHATIAAAKVLFDHYENVNDILSFYTKSGEITCAKKDDKIEMKLPLHEADIQEENISFENLSNLKDEEIINCVYNKETEKLLVEISSLDKLKDVLFDTNKLKSKVFPNPLKGLILTTKGDENFDFYSRYFAPWVGVNEDPVTGSAHTLLYPYWSTKLDKDILLAKQVSKRGGVMELYEKDGKLVILGDCVITFSGQFDGDAF